MATGNQADKKKASEPLDTNLLDYPSTMSWYERENLAAEAKLAAQKKKTMLDSAKRNSRMK